MNAARTPFLASLVVVIGGTVQAGDGKKPERPTAEIAFSLRTWEGEYFSKDISGGVQSTPSLGAIYTIGADGKGLKEIVPPGQGVDFPSFDATGTLIYFQARTSGRHQIYRCKLDGSGVTSLTAGDRLGKEWKDAYGYHLSPKGKMAYTVHDGRSGRVAFAGADGSEPKLVAPELGYIYMAAIDPAGDRVVFSGPAAGYRLKLANLADGKLLDLTPNHPESFVPRFTPDGKTIVFFRRDGDVYSVGADGKDLRRLTKGNRYVEFRLSANDRHGSSDGPDISRDGRRIAYIAVKEGVPNVHTMNLDGSDQRQITFCKSPCGRVRWDADGTRLGFVSFDGTLPQLFVVDAKGGEPRQLTKLKGAVYFLDWK